MDKKLVKCEYCGKEIVTLRSSKRYCNAKCRVGASRVTLSDVTDKLVENEISDVALLQHDLKDPQVIVECGMPTCHEGGYREGCFGSCDYESL